MKYKKKRTYKRKSYGKKKKISKNLRKAVKSIVKSNIETKEFLKEDMNFNINDEVVYALNPMYNITQGTDDFQRIGNKIRLQRIVMKAMLSNGSNTLANNTLPGHVIVWFVRAPMKVSNFVVTGNFNIVGFPEREILFDNTYILDNIPPHFLNENRKRGVVVMMKRKYHFAPQLNTSTNIATLAAPTHKTLTWSINMKNIPFQYEEDNTGFQTKYNYYFLVSGFLQNTGTVNPTVQNLRFQYQTFFKDA